ncbi:MAG: UDP-N-acetyl-D-glucosamine dehydrogenase [Syntrophus sp. (in: bacteria)]|nr:UDP-N-acetyl-D-glucosamine dehydrogenase [Syntrophus sp. (in: bacteria)]
MPIRIALVGAGHMGRIHLEKLSAMDGVQVSGVIDVDEARAKELSGKYRVPAFKEYSDVIPLSDGVVIATPTESHYEIARAFLEKGAHVFIEKPITSNEGEARELIKLARRKELVFQVGHLERFNPVFAKAAAEIRNPLYIEAYRASPFTGRSTDVSVILDVMIHDLDLILSLVKVQVKEVKAHGFPFVADKLDMVNARIEFENGCVANITASRIWTGRVRRMAVFEEDRYFDLDLLSGTIIVATKGKNENMETVEHEISKVDSVMHELMEFVGSIRGETKPSVTGEDGLKALALANLIDQHIATRSST